MAEQVRVADLVRVGAGREAEVFEWDDDHVLRLARDVGAAAVVAREAAALQAAWRARAPVPAVGRCLTVEGRPGLVMDRVGGRDLLERLRRRPWSVRAVGRLLGRLHARLHGVVAPPELPALRAELAGRLGSARVPHAAREWALPALEALPDGDRLCHGDLHPGNVLGRRGGEVVIDWTNAARGDPSADVARTCLLLMAAEIPDDVPPLARRGDSVGRRLLLDAYLRAYARQRPLDLALVERWLPVCAAARLAEGIEHERRPLLALSETRGAGAGLALPGRRPLDSAQRRWLWWNAVAITALVNLVLGAGIAWISTAGMGAIPLWSTPLVGGPSTITDTVGTLFVLPLVTWILVSLAVRREISGGGLRPLGWAEDRFPLLGLLPVGRLARGVGLGALCVALVAPLSIALLVAIDFGHVSPGAFVAYKAGLAVALGVLVTPVIALCAMAGIAARADG